jgi:hypothetical protein
MATAFSKAWQYWRAVKVNKQLWIMEHICVFVEGKIYWTVYNS